MKKAIVLTVLTLGFATAHADEIVAIDTLANPALEALVAPSMVVIDTAATYTSCQPTFSRIKIVNRDRKSNTIGGILSALKPMEGVEYDFSGAVQLDAEEDALTKSFMSFSKSTTSADPAVLNNVEVAAHQLAHQFVQDSAESERVFLIAGSARYVRLSSDKKTTEAEAVVSVRLFFDDANDEALVMAVGQCTEK